MKIIFCLPGREYSREFLLSWSDLLVQTIKKGHEVLISQQYSSVVHFARAKCLGGDVLKGATQKPFQGQVEYDYIMWIDSDIIFSPDDFFKMLDSPHDVTAGYYMMSDLKNLCVVKNWDADYFKQNGSFEFITPEMLKGFKDLTDERYLKVAYSGMGWMLIKSGVIEKLDYPWFKSDTETFLGADGQTIVDISSEDVSFCRALDKVGVPVMLDTSIRVGHIKPVVI
jgi:hypothetical protein